MGVQNLGMKASVLFTGKCIGHAAHSIKLLGNLLSTSLVRPFEQHVLNEMGQAGLIFLFIPRSKIQPDTHGN